MHAAASIGAGSLSEETSGPGLVSELTALRHRKDELEGRMISLQDSRRDLMNQLEGLMRVLKVNIVKYYIILRRKGHVLLRS